jgi:hypothetical protein
MSFILGKVSFDSLRCSATLSCEKRIGELKVTVEKTLSRIDVLMACSRQNKSHV